MNKFQNETVEHSFNCYSVDCMINEKVQHVSIFHFDSEKDSYLADSLQAAAEMWVADGKPTLVNVGRIG